MEISQRLLSLLFARRSNDIRFDDDYVDGGVGIAAAAAAADGILIMENVLSVSDDIEWVGWRLGGVRVVAAAFRPSSRCLSPPSQAPSSSPSSVSSHLPSLLSLSSVPKTCTYYGIHDNYHFLPPPATLDFPMRQRLSSRSRL